MTGQGQAEFANDTGDQPDAPDDQAWATKELRTLSARAREIGEKLQEVLLRADANGQGKTVISRAVWGEGYNPNRRSKPLSWLAMDRQPDEVRAPPLDEPEAVLLADVLCELVKTHVDEPSATELREIWERRRDLGREVHRAATGRGSQAREGSRRYRDPLARVRLGGQARMDQLDPIDSFGLGSEIMDGALPTYVTRDADASLEERLDAAFVADQWDWRARLVVVAGPRRSGTTHSMFQALQASEWSSSPAVRLPADVRLSKLPSAISSFEETDRQGSQRLIILIDGLEARIDWPEPEPFAMWFERILDRPCRPLLVATLDSSYLLLTSVEARKRRFDPEDMKLLEGSSGDYYGKRFSDDEFDRACLVFHDGHNLSPAQVRSLPEVLSASLHLGAGIEGPVLQVILRTRNLCQVKDVPWQDAGVYRPIAELALDDEDQVPFIPRKTLSAVQDRIRSALSQPGPTMITIAGEPASGKTRLALEALRRTCPDAWFIAPTTAETAASGFSPDSYPELREPAHHTDPVVVWLDDVEQFISMDSAHLTRWHLESLRDSQRSIVVMCTRGGRGEARVEVKSDRFAEINDFINAGSDPVYLPRTLTPDELEIALDLIPGVDPELLTEGVGPLAVARPQLQARYEVMPGTSKCADAGNPDEGRALVDGLLVLEAALARSTFTEEMARSAWMAFRSAHGRYAPPSNDDWQSAVEWATCPDVPGHPLVKWNPVTHLWSPSALVIFSRDHPIAQAHEHVSDVIWEWIGEEHERACHVARTAQRPEREEPIDMRLRPVIGALYSKAISIDTSNWALGGLARFHEQCGRIEEARAAYAIALETYPRDPEILLNYGLFAQEYEKPSIARQAHLKAAQVSKSVEALTNLATFLGDNGEEELAEQYFIDALEMNPFHFNALTNYARLLTEQKRHEQAYMILSIVAVADSLDVEIAGRLLDAGARAHVSDFDDEYAAFMRQDVGAWNLTRYARYLKDSGAATNMVEAALRKALEQEPEHLEAINELANLLEERGELDAAADQLRPVAVRDPRSRVRYIKLLEDSGEVARVDEELARWQLTSEGDDSNLILLRAQIMMERKDLENAITLLESFSEDLRRDPQFIGLLANCFHRAGNVQKWLETMQTCIDAYPHDSNLIANLGSALRDLRLTEEAERTLRTGLEWKPRHARCNAELAILLHQDGRSEESLQHLDIARSVDPQDVAARIFDVWLLEGTNEEAARAEIVASLRDNQETAVRSMIALSANATDDDAVKANRLFDSAMQEYFAVSDLFAAYAALVRSDQSPIKLNQLYTGAMRRPSRTPSRSGRDQLD